LDIKEKAFLTNPFELLGKLFINFFEDVGRYGQMLFRMVISLGDIKTYIPLMIEQMNVIGNRSLPIILLVSAFSGMVTAVQSAYQMSAWVPVYLVGSVVGESIVLELSPVVIALVLSGRVGASIAAEIGTMKVTEQIDALESLAFNPISYLVIPRIIAGVIMFPVLVIFGDFIGIVGGWLIALITMDVSTYDFFRGFRQFFIPFDAVYGLIKSIFFGFTITSIACFQGFRAEGGARGVGKVTTNAVVISCVFILVLDYALASVLL